MFSFTSIRRASAPRRFLPRTALILALMFCFAAALFTGCKMDTDNFIDDHLLNAQLIGTWASASGDSYEISVSGDHLTYAFGTSTNYAGSIEYVSNFSDSAGVIIIKYDAGNEQEYYAEFDPETYEPIGDPLPLKGNYIGIYFKELKPGVSVEMAGAYIEGGAEKATLEEARAAFTAGNEGSYIGVYGIYEK